MANYVFILYDRTNTTSKCLLAPRSAEDATVEDEINGIRHLRLSIPLDTADQRQRSNQVARFDVIRMVNIDDTTDNRSFRVYHYTQNKDRPLLTIEADDLILDLARVQFIVDGRADIDYTHTGEGKYIASNATVTTILTAALARSNFTVGTVSAALDASPQEYQFQNETALSVLQKIVEAYKETYPNCGFRRNEDGTIDFLSDLATQDISTFLINRKNLVNLSKDVDVREYANRLFAYGAKSDWQHVHSGIESTITSFVAETGIDAERIYVGGTQSWKWRYGDVGDILYSPSVGSIAAGSSAKTIVVNGLGSITENQFRGGIFEITSGELSGVFRSIDVNDVNGYIALNDKLHFINDVNDIIGKTCRLATRVAPVDIWGFVVKTSEVESATATMLYDSHAHFGTSQEYRSGYLEFLDGNVQGLVTLINSHNNTQLYFPTITIPDTGISYRITANTPIHNCLSIEQPEVQPSSGDVLILRTVDFGGGLIIGKHPKFRSLVTSATNSRLNVAATDGSKFSTYQICQVFSSEINSLDRTRHINIQQFEINSINGDILYPTSSFATVPTKGDQLEILTLVNSTEITSWGAKERIFRDDSISDPFELYLSATDELSNLISLRTSYQIDCLDLWKANPQTYQFNKFEVGDMLSIFDEETQINVGNLRIVRKVWKPLTPWIVESLEVNEAAHTFASRALSETQILKKVIDTQSVNLRNKQHETCFYWDEQNKRCTRQKSPNTFCASEKSNSDGKLRSDKAPITKADCNSFIPRSAGAQGEHGGYAFKWKYSENVSASPTYRYFQFNNDDPTLITQIYINNQNYEDSDVKDFLDSFNIGGLLKIYKETNPNTYWIGIIIEKTDNTSDFSYDVLYQEHDGNFSHGELCVIDYTPKGALGGYAHRWRFNVNTSPPPANKYIQLNNSDPTLVTQIYVSSINLEKVNVADFLASLISPGHLKIFDETDVTIYWIGAITHVTDSGSYFTYDVTYLGHNGGFTNNDLCVVDYTQSGTSGTSSTSGTAGTSSTSGTSGTSSTSGTAGTSSTSGTAGTSSTSGTAGTSSTSGTAGTSSTSGTAGTSSTSGTAGTSSTSGTSGTSSTSGTAGTSSTSGTSGTSSTVLIVTCIASVVFPRLFPAIIVIL
jgi:hypothetical protein